MCLNKYKLKSDSVIFVMITKIDPSRDPMYIIPAFTGQLLRYFTDVKANATSYPLDS